MSSSTKTHAVIPVQEAFAALCAKLSDPAAVRLVPDQHYESCALVLEPCDLLRWAARCPGHSARVYFRDRDNTEEAFAFGEAERFFLTDITDCDALWRRIIQKRANDASGPLRFYGGLSFAPDPQRLWPAFGRAWFFLPQIEIRRQGQDVVLLGRLPLALQPRQQLRARVQELLKGRADHGQADMPKICSERLEPDRREWQRRVQDLLNFLEQGRLKKAVLGRQVHWEYDQDLPMARILARMRDLNPQSYVFLLRPDQDHALLGASPEQLYRREGRKIWTEALAGTACLAPGQPDHAAESGLLRSDKDLREHAFVADMLSMQLQQLCGAFHRAGTPQVMRTPGGLHLWTPFAGDLKAHVQDQDILAALQPTPAVAGWPVPQALAYLKEQEEARGWFAGAVGYVSKEQSEFCVVIRSALIRHQSVTAFAGAGIVNGSKPEREWDETALKLDSILEACR